METADAIVLRSIDFSESSNVLTLFTRPFGKIRALAKGARRLKNPFESSLDVMARVCVTFISKRGEQLDLLTEAKLIWRFRPIWNNFAGMHAGLYLLELLNELTHDHDPNERLFDLAVATLERFAVGTNVCRTLLRAEWKLLERIGQFPSLRRCIECGTMIDENSRERVTVGLLDGGVLCRNCRAGHQPVVTVSADALRGLLVLAGNDREAWHTQPMPRGILNEIRGLTNQYMTHLIGKRPRMHDYLATMARYDRPETLESTHEPKRDTDVRNDDKP